jgi:Spy/CpxP family protein refolding chaperone
MKMKTKRSTWIMATLVAVLLAAAALLYGQAQQPNGWEPGMGMGHKRFLNHMAQALQLTDAQKAQIKSMWQAEKPTVQPLLQQLAENHKQMLAVTANGAFDQAKVTAIANQQSQTLAQLIVEKEKLQSQIYSQVLTPEQRTKADELRQKHAARIDQWLQQATTSAPGQ